jgi:hypothetical protein
MIHHFMQTPRKTSFAEQHSSMWDAFGWTGFPSLVLR